MKGGVELAAARVRARGQWSQERRALRAALRHLIAAVTEAAKIRLRPRLIITLMIWSLAHPWS